MGEIRTGKTVAQIQTLRRCLRRERELQCASSMRHTALRWLTTSAASLSLVTAALLGCAPEASQGPTEKSATATRAADVAFRGSYEATSANGEVGTLAFLDDGTYVFRAHGCRTSSCLESGAASLDARHETLTLTATRGTDRTFRVEVLATSASTATALSTRTLIEGDAGALTDAGQQLAVDAGHELTEVVRQATLDGQPVELLDGVSRDGGVGGNGNEPSPVWPGKIAGVGPLDSPIYGNESTLVHPTGNAVTVADPEDPAFADDRELAAKYAGTANLYNSHGMPGKLIGGIPEAETRKLVNDDSKPMIVASCFSAAPMAGGSTIRRLVSTYADDPTSTASRVYGCSGYASGSAADGIGCTGSWLNANGQAVPLVERQRLGLHQEGCVVNAIDANGEELVTGCRD